MVNLLSWGRKAYDQVNPFDNGKTWSTPSRPAIAPQTVQAIQNARYGVLANNPQAQANLIASTQPSKFDVRKAAISALADTFTKPELLANAPKLNVGGFRGSGLIEDFVNSPYKIAGGGVKVGQGQVKQGVGDIITGALEGPAGLIPISRVAQAGKGASLATKVLTGAKSGLIEGAVSGGLYGGGQAASQNASNADILKQLAAGTAIGGAGGAILGGGVPAITGGVKASVNKAAKPVYADFDPKAKPKVSLKERGFQKNVTKNLPKSPTAQAIVDAMPGYKPITNKNTLNAAARKISENPQAEFARVITKKQLTSANDVATGNLLLREAIEGGDVETAIQLGTKMGIDGTKLGQAVQAYATLKKTTPEGVLTYASKKARGIGNELDPVIAQRLIAKAKEVAQMPEGLEKAKATRDLLGQAEAQGRNWVDTTKEILSAPRAMMATADLSAPLRQGAVLGSRFPKEFAKVAKESAQYFASPGAYEKSMYEISQRPRYPLMKSHKLAVNAAEELSGTEEAFMRNILETKAVKSVGVGQVVAASDRGYTGFLTKFRADVFDKIVGDSEKAGVKLGKKELDSLAKYINSASGRGSGKFLDKHAGALSAALFSPRLWKSRIDTFNPVYIARLKGPARTYALQSAASFASIATTILGLAAAAGASVERDPRSADFGKIKVGNTRYDILGGHQQNIRLASQLVTGQKINSETGEIQTLGPDRGFGKPSRVDLAYQFLENKENPVLGLGTKLLRGTDQAGNKLNPVTETAKLGIPLSFQGAYDTAKDVNSLPKGIAMNIPGTFGVGVQTYGSGKSKNAKVSAATTNTPTKEDTDKELKTLKDAPPEGFTLQKVGNKFAYTLDDGEVKTAKTYKEAREAIAKAGFKNEGGSYKILGNKVYRKNADGDVSIITKDSFDYQLGTATLTSQKRAGNLEGWMKTANSQLELIDKQLKDPNIDPLEAIKLQNQADALLENIEKYAGYGGFKKGKSGKGGGRVAIGSFKTANSKIPQPKGVSVRKLAAPSFKSAGTKKLSVSKIPSSYTKRRLA